MRPLLVLSLVLAAVVALVVVLYMGSGEHEGGQAVAPTAVEPQAQVAKTPELSKPEQTKREDAVPPPSKEALDEEPGVASKEAVNSLVGTVFDQDQKPLAGALVRLSRDPQMGEAISMQWFLGKEPTGDFVEARTGSDGVYRFTSVQPANDYFVMASHPDYSQAQEEMVFVGEAGEFRGPDITLTPGSALEGYVLDVGGNPVPNAVLDLDSAYMMGMDPQSPDRLSGHTDDTGYYQLKNVNAGPRNLTVSAEGYGRQIKDGLMFKGDPGEKVQQDFRLQPGFPIAGRVFDQDNNGLPGARIIALNHGNSISSRGEAVSDDDGHFQIDDLQQGSYILMVELFGYRNSRANRVQASDMNVQLEMIKQACIDGRVTASQGAVGEFTATLLRVQPNPAMGQTEDIYETTGVHQKFDDAADGAFQLCGLDPGEFAVQVKAKGFAPSMSASFTVIDGQPVAPVAIQLSPGGSIRGRVVDASGAPVAHAVVSSHDDGYAGNMLDDFLDGLIASRTTQRKTRTDESGAFELRLLNPGNYKIQVTHAKFTDGEVKGLKLAEGQQVDAGSITLSGGGTITGKVFDQAGNPTVRGFVKLVSDDGNQMYEARTDKEGRYTIEHVRPGSYKLSAMRSTPTGGTDAFNAILDQQHSEVALQVTEGATVPRDLKLAP